MQEENNRETEGKKMMKRKQTFHNDLTVPRKFHCSKWRHDQDTVLWIKLEEAQDLGLQFWQTKSNAIVVYNPVPPQCICKVVAKMNLRAIFERVPEPQPPPNVILKSHWQVQQQQQLAKPSSGKPGKRDWDAATSHRESPQDDDRVEITTSIFQQDGSQN